MTQNDHKKVIYSALVGEYDNVLQPKAVCPQYDYILFSNTIKEKRIGVWEVRDIPYRNEDNVRIARWAKTHPHVLLPEYSYCVWTDANVRIASEEAYQHFDSLFDKGIQIASFAHPERECIYDEALTVLLVNKDTIDKILPEILFLKHQGYPLKQGLYETNSIFLQHQNPQVQQALDDWWGMIDNFSRRDQLSFNYVLWKHGIEQNYLLPKSSSSRNHRFYEYYQHVSDPTGTENEWVGFLVERSKESLVPAYWELIRAENGTVEEQKAVCRLEKIFYYIHRDFLLSNAEQRRNDMEAEIGRMSKIIEEQQKTINEVYCLYSKKKKKHLLAIRLLSWILVVSLFLILLLLLLQYQS